MNEESLEQLIALRLAGLSGQLQKAARYLLAHQEDVALGSMRELAAAAGLPAVTFVRLARALGFADYLALRAMAQKRVRAPFSPKAREMPGAGLAAQIFAADAANVERTSAANTPGAMASVVALMRRERRVFVFGQRSSFAAAHLLHYIMALFRRNVTLVEGQAGMLANDLREIGTGDVLVVIGLSPYSADVPLAARLARAQGASIVLISDVAAGLEADVTLLIACETPAFFHSLSGVVSLVQALAAELLLADGAAGLAALAESEQYLLAFGAFAAEGV